VKAVCTKCGAIHEHFDRICPTCGARPTGDGVLAAWLLSSNNLSDEEMERVSARIAAGEVIRPSERQLREARVQLGVHLTSDPGMTVQQRVALLFTSLLLTPLVGWALWVGWRRARPRAAMEALALSLPASALFFVLIPLSGYAWVLYGG